MKQNNYVVIFTILVGIILSIAALYDWFAPVEWKYTEEFTEATIMINAIEEFKEREGRYPVNSNEAGIEEKMTGPYYNLYKDNTYVVSFPGGSCFFCSQVYYSSTNTWSEHD